MQLTKDKKQFAPVTIVIESQDEFDFFCAISNNKITEVKAGGAGMGIVLSNESIEFADLFYREMKKLRESL